MLITNETVSAAAAMLELVSHIILTVLCSDEEVKEENGKEEEEEPFYDKKSSFFDRISCEALESKDGRKVVTPPACLLLLLYAHRFRFSLSCLLFVSFLNVCFTYILFQGRPDWKKERETNQETFGPSALRQFGFRGFRGGVRGGYNQGFRGRGYGGYNRGYNGGYGNYGQNRGTFRRNNQPREQAQQ